MLAFFSHSLPIAAFDTCLFLIGMQSIHFFFFSIQCNYFLGTRCKHFLFAISVVHINTQIYIYTDIENITQLSSTSACAHQYSEPSCISQMQTQEKESGFNFKSSVIFPSSIWEAAACISKPLSHPTAGKI